MFPTFFSLVETKEALVLWFISLLLHFPLTEWVIVHLEPCNLCILPKCWVLIRTLIFAMVILISQHIYLDKCENHKHIWGLVASPDFLSSVPFSVPFWAFYNCNFIVWLKWRLRGKESQLLVSVIVMCRKLSICSK